MMNKVPTFGSRVRKRLSDITNIHSSNHKSPSKDQENVPPPPPPVTDDPYAKNYVYHLVKENEVMIKLIEEKDKIIESNGVELLKLRAALQKTQLQNWNLAQNNSQMLAELNQSKERLKTLQHDLTCKDALYKAKTHESQVEAKREAEVNNIPEVKTIPENAAVDQPQNFNDKNEKKVSKTKRGRPTRSQSLGATSSQQEVDKEIAENKRRCTRRQSIRSKPQESETELYEIDVKPKVPLELLRPSISERDEPPPPPSQSPKSKVVLPRRSSVGRPMRKAAEKIQSYKDIPLNVKMRRPS